MRRPQLHALALWVTIALSTPLAASAQAPASVGAEPVDETEARALFDAGSVAFEAGRYDAAVTRFQEAYELTHRPIILWNVALAADRARQNELALTMYRRFLAEVPDTAEVHDFRVRALARLDVIEREVAIARQAEEQARQAEIERQRAEQAEVEMERAEQEAERARAEAAAARTEAERAENSSRLVNKWWFWTLVGVGVAGAVAVPVTIASTRTSGSSFPATDHGNIVFALSGRF